MIMGVQSGSVSGCSARPIPSGSPCTSARISTSGRSRRLKENPEVARYAVHGIRESDGRPMIRRIDLVADVARASADYTIGDD